MKDSPLTNVGILQATLIGRAMRRRGIKIDRVYSSPAFRSIHTASAALEGLDQKDEVTVNVEGALFEWFGWHSEAGADTVDWLEPAQLKEVGIRVNDQYKQQINTKEMLVYLNETMEEFEERCGKFVENIANSADGENILFAAHGPTGQVTQQRLRGGPVITVDEMMLLMPKTPYCSMTVLERDLSKGKEWVLKDECYSVTHQQNRTWNAGVFGF